jgi:hypothetical protein
MEKEPILQIQEKPKRQPRKPMFASKDVYEQILAIAAESGRGVQEVTDMMLHFAAEHIEIIGF